MLCFYNAKENSRLAIVLVLQIAFDFLFMSVLKMAFGPEARGAAPTTNDIIFATWLQSYPPNTLSRLLWKGYLLWLMADVKVLLPPL